MAAAHPASQVRECSTANKHNRRVNRSADSAVLDLAGADELASTHVREAIQYRSLDRRKAAA